MGRAPCCEKVGLKRGRWTSEEDERLTKYIQANGEGSWKSLPKNAGLLRCGKSCRLRWINYLRGDLKRGNMTLEEDETILKLQKAFGNRWSKIASHLPGRTDNEIKNYWNSHLSRQIYRLFTSKKDETQKSIDTPTMVTRKKQSVGRVSRSVAKKYNNDRVFKNKKSSHVPAIKLSTPQTVVDKQVIPNIEDCSNFVDKNINESQVYWNDVSKELGSDKLGFQDDELIDISYFLESGDMGSNGVLSIHDDDQIEQMLAETGSGNLEKSEWNVNGREDEDLSYNLSKTMEVCFDEIEWDMEFGFNTWDKEDDMLVWLWEGGN